MNLNYEYLSTQSELQKVHDWLKDRKFFVTDTETDGINPYRNHISTLQIGDEKQQWIVDVRTIDIQSLKPYFENPLLVKVGQNLKFDWQFMYLDFKWDMQGLWDTMIAEQIIRCGLHVRVGLGALMERYFNVPINKSDVLRIGIGKTPANTFTTEQKEYMAGDVVYPQMIAKKQQPELALRKLNQTLKIENEFIPVLARMELQGMTLDIDQWQTVYYDSVKQLKAAEKKLDEFFQVNSVRQENLFEGSDIVRAILYSSPAQVKKALERKGFQVEDTNSKTLALGAIQGILPVDLVQELLSYRTYFTRVTRYGLNFLDAIDPDTKRIHTIFSQAVTNSGRLASGQRAGSLNEDGETTAYRVNFQNIPSDKEYRNCFVPRKGYVFLIYDCQAIEPRILGELSQDRTYLEAFKNNKDIYGEVGSQIYGEPVNKKSDRGKELRDKTKVVVLGNAYGTGKEKFHKKLLTDFNLDPDGQLKTPITEITREESDNLWEKFFKICPDIRETLDQLSADADPVKSPRRIYDQIAANESYEEVYAKCLEVLEKQKKRYPKGIEAIASRLAKNRAFITYSESIGGKKVFFKVYHKSTWTEARDFPMQSTAALILKQGMVDIAKTIKQHNHDAEFVNQVHDEIIIEVREDQAEAVAVYVKPLMEKAGEKFLKTIPCRVEGGRKSKWEKD